MKKEKILGFNVCSIDEKEIINRIFLDYQNNEQVFIVNINPEIAVDNYNSKTGEKGADFIPVVIWGKQAENTAQYMTKGSQVAISGRITTRSYDAKDGTKRYVTEVVADMINGVQFLSKGKVNEMNQDPGNTFDSMGFDDGMTPVDDGDMPF